jgi:hypothetical protein
MDQAPMGMKCLINPLVPLISTTPNPRPSMNSKYKAFIEVGFVTRR